jgi:hypothetical protein
MFNKPAPVTEPAHDNVVDPAELIPLSVLQLEMEPPAIGGWDVYLTGRGIPIVLDHIGRSAICSADARQLLDEKRADELRRREWAARQEQAAVERDRAFRAALPKGTHWTDIPVGVSAPEMWAQAEKDAQPKRRGVLQEALSQSSMTFHSFAPTPDEG